MAIVLMGGQLAGLLPPRVETGDSPSKQACCCCGAGQRCVCPCSRGEPSPEAPAPVEAMFCTCDEATPALPAVPFAGVQKPRVSDVCPHCDADAANAPIKTNVVFLSLRNHDPPSTVDLIALSTLLI